MKPILLSLLVSLSLGATTVTSITGSGQTCTVNATAHGLAASQGFELNSGQTNQFNSTVVTASTNSFTFTLPAGSACSTFTSGYTTVNAAIQIVELPGVALVNTGQVSEQALYWFTTVYPNPLSCPNSVCPVSQWAGANAAQNAAIAAGTTVEINAAITVAANTVATAVQTLFQNQYNTMQAGFAGYLLAQGYCYNGTAWVAAAAGSCK